MRAGYYRTMEYVQRRLEQRGFGDVRPAHMMIFQHVRPEGSRVGELAERAHLTNQSVGYLVDYLERQGYMERRPDPSNRRATLVCLTDRGWQEMAACAGILDELDAELVGQLGDQRLQQLHDLLVEFVNALQITS
jgi:DNA-binding MarR family transcriptional regulator